MTPSASKVRLNCLASTGSIFRQIAGYLGHLQVSFIFSLIVLTSDIELFYLIVGKNPDYVVGSHFSAIKILQHCQWRKRTYPTGKSAKTPLMYGQRSNVSSYFDDSNDSIMWLSLPILPHRDADVVLWDCKELLNQKTSLAQFCSTNPYMESKFSNVTSVNLLEVFNHLSGMYLQLLLQPI